MASNKWYIKIPHPVIMLFSIIVLMTILSYIIPAGAYERILAEGRQRVVPGSFKYIDQTPISFMDMFRAFPIGFKTAIEIIWVVLASGIMFGILEKSKMIENGVASFIKALGSERKFLIIIILTFVYGMLGVAVGYENNIAMVPIAAVVVLALGGDLVLAAGVSVAAITVGFGLSPINPYTVGTGHKIAEMPLFSGFLLRAVLCFIGMSLLAFYNIRYFKKIILNKSEGLGNDLNEEGFRLSKPLESYQMTANNWLVLMIFLGGLGVMLFGIFKWHWFINEVSSIFLIITILTGIFCRMNPTEFSNTVLKSVAVVAPGAFMVGLATTIKVIMEMGNIGDSIAYTLSSGLSYLPIYASAIVMSLSQCVMNFLIPSGSGQALATLPIMLPVGELVGLTRQSTILAFQIGDGVTNLVNPTLGGLIAMLSLCRVPFDKWLKFIAPLVLWILIIALCFLVFSVAIEWGPV